LKVLLQDFLPSLDSNSHPDPHHQVSPRQEDKMSRDEGFIREYWKPKHRWRDSSTVSALKGSLAYIPKLSVCSIDSATKQIKRIFDIKFDDSFDNGVLSYTGLLWIYRRAVKVIGFFSLPPR
jgi:hypothetical protein